MKTNLFKRISSLFGSEKIRFRKKFLIYSVFLVFAIIIWLLKALEKNYTTEIDYPVRYRNIPSDKTLVGELPDRLQLNVYAHGYVLLQNKISSRYIPLVINVNSFSLRQLRTGDSTFYYLETRFLKDYIDKQLSSEFEILEINPDTLIFPFAKMIERRVPVKAAFNYQLEKQMINRNQPLIKPDTVNITGPDYLLDTLSFVHTQDKDFGVISTDRELDIKVEAIKHTTIKPEKLLIRLEVEKFTEKSISVPLKVINSPDSLRIITFPRQITVTCQVGLSNYEKARPELFDLSVDYKDIASGLTRLPVLLNNSPEFVRSVKYNPKSVEYLIQK